MHHVQFLQSVASGLHTSVNVIIYSYICGGEVPQHRCGLPPRDAEASTSRRLTEVFEPPAFGWPRKSSFQITTGHAESDGRHSKFWLLKSN